MQAISPTDRPKLSPRARLQTDKVTGKPIVLYPEGVLILNSTGHAIVALCTGDATVEEMLATLAARHGRPAAEISAEVIGYLNRLRERNLLQIGNGPGPGG